MRGVERFVPFFFFCCMDPQYGMVTIDAAPKQTLKLLRPCEVRSHPCEWLKPGPVKVGPLPPTVAFLTTVVYILYTGRLFSRPRLRQGRVTLGVFFLQQCGSGSFARVTPPPSVPICNVKNYRAVSSCVREIRIRNGVVLW